MNGVTTVLLVACPPDAVEPVRHVLMQEPDVLCLVAGDAAEAAETVRHDAPDLVVVALGDGAGVIDAAARLRELPGPPRSVLLVTDARGTDRLQALRRGVDEVLSSPLEAADLLPRVRAAVRERALRSEAERARVELERVTRMLQDSTNEMVAAMAYAIDARTPGGRARDERIASWAAGLAERFGIPQHLRPDLQAAARLHGVGWLAWNGATPAAEWPFATVSASILDRMQALQNVAEVVQSIQENWDGTGHPDHLLQGQIPLRSRILRVLIDFSTALEAEADVHPVQLLERLGEHSGTAYDPMVLVYFKALLQRAESGPAAAPSRVVPVTALEVGMVLAEDLHSSSGIKLLARDATVTPMALDTIIKRHQVEPIVHGVAVYRGAA